MRQEHIDKIYQNYFLLSNSQMYRDVFEISHAEFWLMEYLQVYQGQPDQLTVSSIADSFNVSNPAISRLVKTMLCNQWIERQENPDDRRVIHLTLTDKGLAVYRLQKQRFRQRMEDIYAGISDEDVERLAQITSHLLSRVNYLKQEDNRHFAPSKSPATTCIGVTSETNGKAVPHSMVYPAHSTDNNSSPASRQSLDQSTKEELNRE